MDYSAASPGHLSPGENIHSVQFYEDDGLFLDSMGEFLGAALGAGGACLLIATQTHRTGIVERLKASGIGMAYAMATGRFVSLDAYELLGRFMVGGQPDEELFIANIEPELMRVRASLRRQSTSVVAFGEMVTILWREGRYEAAIEVEKLWDELVQRHEISLRCAYPMGLFSDQAQYALFRRVCAHHNQIVAVDEREFPQSGKGRLGLVTSRPEASWTMQTVMRGREEELKRLKKTEERLKSSEEFARSLAECSIDCVGILDCEGRVQYLSPSGVEAFSAQGASHLPGRKWVELWRSEDRARAEAALQTARRGERSHFSGERSLPDGTRTWWDVKITPAFNDDRRVERLIVVSRDNTELHFARAAAIEAEKQATAGRLAATIAHEVNNPLEAVTNFIYLAQTVPGMPEEALRYLQTADEELSRAAQISRQTLGFYKTTARASWIPVQEMLQGVATIFERKLHHKQIAGSVYVEPGLEVHGKEGELRQALLNLISNAIDASRPGSKIRIRAMASTNWKSEEGFGVRITVADNGHGIAPELQHRIFVPFFTTKRGHGTGLGLWVTKCLIDQHDGVLRMRSRAGERSGTVMSIFLPEARIVTIERADVA